MMSSIASRIRSFFDQEQAGNDYVSLENAETLAALTSRKDRVEGRL